MVVCISFFPVMKALRVIVVRVVPDGLTVVFFFQGEDGIRNLVGSRGRGDVYKRRDLPAVIAAGVNTAPVVKTIKRAVGGC